jgi:hypothetical protein
MRQGADAGWAALRGHGTAQAPLASPLPRPPRPPLDPHLKAFPLPPLPLGWLAVLIELAVRSWSVAEIAGAAGARLR